MKLIAEIKDADLLFKMVHQLGMTVYRLVGDGNVEVVYYSGEKFVHFQGKLSPDQQKILEANGWKVSGIEIDESEGEVKIKQ